MIKPGSSDGSKSSCCMPSKPEGKRAVERKLFGLSPGVSVPANHPFPIGRMIDLRVYTASSRNLLKAVTLFDHPDPAQVVIQEQVQRVDRGTGKPVRESRQWRPYAHAGPSLRLEPANPQLWVTYKDKKQLVGMFEIPFIRDGIKWYRNPEGFEFNYEDHSLDKRQAHFSLSFFYQGRSHLVALRNEA
jgi:hypothetical protein